MTVATISAAWSEARQCDTLSDDRAASDFALTNGTRHAPCARDVHTAEIALARDLNGLERDWLIRYLMLLPGVSDAFLSYNDPRRLVIEYDRQLLPLAALAAYAQDGWRDGPRYRRRRPPAA